MKTIRVTGTAERKLRPDVTVVTMTLQGAEPEYSAAMNRASREADELRDVLERLSFDREDLKTLSFHVNTEYEGYEESGVWKQRFAGYRFEHMLKVSFDSDHERLGAVLTALANSAVSPMLQISYTLKDPEAAKKMLLTAAVSDAKEKAQMLAEASGVRLLALQSMEHTTGEPGFDSLPMHRLDAPMAVKASIEMNLEPDDITITDRVTCVWEMEQA